MAKRRSKKNKKKPSKRVSTQRAKFSRAAKAAMSNCIVSAGERGGSSDKVRKNYGSCLRKEMKARL